MSDNVTPLTGPARRKDVMAPTEPGHVHELEPWEPALPIAGAVTPPAFPTETLPEPFRQFVEATSAAMRTAPDILGAFVLPVLSTVTAGRWEVEVDPGWSEPLTLHVVAVARSGSMKSAAVEAAIAPLVAIQTDLNDLHGPDVAEAATLRRIEEGKLKRLETEAATAKNPDAMREALDLARHLADEVVPVVPELFTTDSTPEALEVLLAAHGERFAWLDTEGGIFGMAAGRYQSGSVNIDVFLKGHNGDTLKVARVGRPGVELTRPSLTIGVTVQPDVFTSAARNLDLAGRGLFARQLIAWPDLNPVDRSTPAPPAAEGVADTYRARVLELYRASEQIPKGTTRRLTVEADALDALRAWFGQTYAGQQAGGAYSVMPEWASKLDGATVRLAGILTLAADPDALEVNLDAATRAVMLARYFSEHALRAFGEVGLRDDVQHARTCLAAIRRGPGMSTPADRWKQWPNIITTRDVHGSVRNSDGLEAAADVHHALEYLAELGHLRAMPRAGKSEPWAVHPDTCPKAD